MLFNSLEFAFFFALVFVLYYGIFNRGVRLRNSFLLLCSYIFYGWWDWRFLGLIALSSLVDFSSGLRIGQSDSKSEKKLWLGLSLITNLGILGYFKYANFFLENFYQLFGINGWSSLSIILPVGISFYTFQTMSYTIDVYRGKVKPTTDPFAFFAYVAFFPQLVAGPIERAASLLPQFTKPSQFNYAKAADGGRMILWGLFTKVVIADSLAPFVDLNFSQPWEYSGLSLLGGLLAFTIQIYGDFAGYSLIAIGVARILGFELMYNFKTPYFSFGIREFWQRWHISLSTWFRDYVYIPLGGNRGSNWRQSLNAFVTFVLSGLWHGANWTFLIWGGIHGSAYVIEARSPWRLPKWLSYLLTIFVVILAWTFFRADSFSSAMLYFELMAKQNFLSGGSGLAMPATRLLILSGLTVLLLLVEWLGRHQPHPLQIASWSKWLRWPVYFALVFAVLYFFQTERSFIYFQF